MTTTASQVGGEDLAQLAAVVTVYLWRGRAMRRLLLVFSCCLLGVAIEADAELVTGPPVGAFVPNSVYSCDMDEFRSMYLTDRAEWLTSQPPTLEDQRPYSFTLKFGTSLEKGAVFIIEWNADSQNEKAVGYGQYVLAHADLGNGIESILFFGPIGQGVLTGDILNAGLTRPVRMAWTDNLSMNYDAYMHCQRTGAYAEPIQK